MLTFKEITLADKETINNCYPADRCKCCDFSFANVFCWAPKFHTKFAIVQNTLFLDFTDNYKHYYTMPMGQMNIKESISLILKDAEDRGLEFTMRGITSKMWDIIEDAYPKMFVYESDRDNAEYIYETEKMITLAGKKLQKKRNHINKFKSENPDWRYEKIKTQEQLNQCLEMLIKWDNITHDDKHQNYDFIASSLMIKHFHELDLRGGMIIVNNQIVAFSIGSVLCHDLFGVHLEKAFADINGAYTIMNQQFAEHEAAEYKYINREEDMGIEGLRKAKMSYYPEILLKEGVVTLRK